MSHRVYCVVAAAGTAAAACSAQSFTNDTTVTFSLSWSEVDANYQPVPSPDGLLQPGERALIRMSASFTNQNTIAHFSPPIGTFGSGTIRGFGVGWLDLHGSGGAEGSWNVDRGRGFGVNPFWDIFDREGTPASGGSRLLDIEMSWFPPQITIVTTNPIPSLWLGVWTPSEFSVRNVTFQTAANASAGAYFAAVATRLSSTLDASIYCPANLGSVQIAVAPAPGALLALGLAAARRGRRAAT